MLLPKTVPPLLPVAYQQEEKGATFKWKTTPETKQQS